MLSVLAKTEVRVAVVGGGAAGFFGAIAAVSANPALKVAVLEAGRQVLAKVLISGGGRCNVTHACFEPARLVQHYPRGGKALRGAFTRFQPRDMVAWLECQGVRLKTEADGRMFPVTDKAATIVNCLVQAAVQAGVQVQTGVAVVGVQRDSDGQFQLRCRNGEQIDADRLLLATGSSALGWRLAKALGHEVSSPVPSLFTFNLPDARLADLAGVSVPTVQVELHCDRHRLTQTGPVLITHWGLSGPAILKLSAWGARLLHEVRYQAKLIINWLPEENPERLRQRLTELRTSQPRRLILSQCPVALPRRLWERLATVAGVQMGDRWAGLSKKTLNCLIEELTRGEYAIKGKGVFKEEFVTCGGVDLKQVDFKTMESRCCSGLYFAGEVLDIDGVTGGFNFQSAWTTGWLAGQAIAQSVKA